MGILAGESISPSDFIKLKEKIKNIMLNKRIHYGSLKEYGGSAYDYSTNPTTNCVILAEHQNKIVEPMRAITTNNVDAIAKKDDKIISLYNISTIIDGFDAKTATSSVKDCQNYCSGLCVEQCSAGCTGCTGCSGCGSGCASGCSGCTDSCKDDCDTGCTGTCKGCSSTCKGGCKGSCTQTCEAECRDHCADCSLSCIGSCENSCDGGCTGTCRGCSSTCSGVGCKGTCNTGCTGGCTYNCAIGCRAGPGLN